jgi:ACS family glucarate transporter-like MFS transporter
MPAAALAVPARARPTSVRWRICALTTLASFVAYVLRTNMSVAGQPMAVDLGLTHVQLGIVLAGFAWGYAAFQFPGGVLGDLIGARRALTVLALLWAALNALIALVPGRGVGSAATVIVALMMLRLLMGVAQAPLYPIIGGGTVCSWFPVSGWALPNALQNVGLTFGAAATGPLIACLTERAGWRASFLLTAPLGVLLAAVWWWYVRDRPADHLAVNGEEAALIDAGRPPAPARPQPGSWRTVLRDRQVQLLTAGYCSANFVFYFFFNWLFIYLIENRGFKLLQGGWYASIPWISGAAGAFAGGWLCDRLWKRLGARLSCRSLGAAGLVMSGVALIAAALATDPIVAVVFLSLCLAAEQFTDAAYWAATIAVAGRHASTACGILNTGGNLANGIVALLVPLMVDRIGWSAALASGSGFAFIAAALWLVTAVDRPISDGTVRVATAAA